MGPTRRTRLRRYLAEKFVWPVLDARDFVLRRKGRPALYAVHHVPRRVRFRWAVLDAWDKLGAPFARMRRLARGRPAVPALALGGVLLAATAGVAYATLSAGSGGDGGPTTAQANDAPRRLAKPAAPRVEVAGVIETSEARAERRARRRGQARRERAAERRRAARRRAARRKATKRRREAAAAPAPAPPPATSPAPEPEPSNPAPAPSPPAAAPPPPPASGGGGGGSGGGSGGGGGGGGRPPAQPQSSPGVEFDDEG